jgi:hypothetical protein
MDPTKNRRQTDPTKNRRRARRSCFLLDTRRVNHIVKSYENLVGNRKKRKKKVLCIMLCFSSRLSVVPRLLFLSFDMQTISSTTLEFSLSISCKTGSLTCSGNACICRDYLHLFKLLLHLSLSSENLHQPRSFCYLEQIFTTLAHPYK